MGATTNAEEAFAEVAADGAGAWLYYVAKTDSGTVLIIARWNGPQIEILTHEGKWIPRPELLTRFQDPGYLEQVTPAEAQEATQEAKIQQFVDDAELARLDLPPDDSDPSFPSPQHPTSRTD